MKACTEHNLDLAIVDEGFTCLNPQRLTKCRFLQYMVVNESIIYYIHHVVIKNLFVKFLKLASSTNIVHMLTVLQVVNVVFSKIHSHVVFSKMPCRVLSHNLKDPIGQQQV